MSRHGWAARDKVAVKESTRDWWCYSFGVVIKCTPTTIKVAFFDPVDADADYLTCRFDTPGVRRSETYAWCPETSTMGQSEITMRACVTHYDDAAEYPRKCH